MIKKPKEDMKTNDNEDCWHTIGNNSWYENRVQHIARISGGKKPNWNKTWKVLEFKQKKSGEIFTNRLGKVKDRLSNFEENVKGLHNKAKETSKSKKSHKQNV